MTVLRDSNWPFLRVQLKAFVPFCEFADGFGAMREKVFLFDIHLGESFGVALRLEYWVEAKGRSAAYALRVGYFPFGLALKAHFRACLIVTVSYDRTKSRFSIWQIIHEFEKTGISYGFVNVCRVGPRETFQSIHEESRVFDDNWQVDLIVGSERAGASDFREAIALDFHTFHPQHPHGQAVLGKNEAGFVELVDIARREENDLAIQLCLHQFRLMYLLVSPLRSALFFLFP